MLGADSRLENHRREFPGVSSVITLEGLPEPRFHAVSVPDQCDDGEFSWVGGAAASASVQALFKIRHLHNVMTSSMQR